MREVVGEDLQRRCRATLWLCLCWRVPHGECRSAELIAIRAVACFKIPLYVLFAGSFSFEVDTLEWALVFASNQGAYILLGIAVSV